MADNRLTTNILLRFAKYSQWMNSTVILQPGEAAVAAFPNVDPSQPARAFGIKVGDGVRYFSELPWIQAVAADVYEWAKDPTKPVYQATEIVGLAEYIAAHSGGSGGSGNAGSGQYQIIWDNASSKYILQQWSEEHEQWENTASEINLSDILNRINTIERWANGAVTKLGNIEMPLTAYVYEEVINQLSKLNYPDSETQGQFVTSVSQVAGKIAVTRAPINASQITQGILGTPYGGTGLQRVDEDEVLVGSLDGTIIKKKFVTEIENNRNAFATTGAIIDYVTEKTAGLTGAMHFVGETAVVIDSANNSRVNPQINGYDFSNARPGDVILANNAQEYVWTGSNWRLLGDEGSYAVKGSIVNADINENANIAQSKIENLTDDLESKVDKVEGKQLSTNDFTTEYKEKLDEIEDYAQENIIEHIIVNGSEVQPDSEKTVSLEIPILTEEQITAINNAQPNVIEHILVNGTEIPPAIINQQPKSVNIEFIPYSQEEKDKLAGIAAHAQVNTVESIIVNNTEYTPNNSKQIEIPINLEGIEGARYPNGATYAEVEIINRKLQLSKIAATGNIGDLVQTANTYIILNCGSSTQVI